MVSPFLEGWLTFGNDSSALLSALRLPSLAAAELERKNVHGGAALAAAVPAMTEYLTTIAGTPPKGTAADAFYAKVAQVTGMPLDIVGKYGGFVSDDYVKDLRAADGKIVSRYDAGFAVDDPFPEQRSSRGSDPVLDGVSRAYGGAMASYARNELGFKTEITYSKAGERRHRRLGLKRRPLPGLERGRPGASPAFSPSFKLLIAHGVTDMVTPHAATRYVLDHPAPGGGGAPPPPPPPRARARAPPPPPPPPPPRLSVRLAVQPAVSRRAHALYGRELSQGVHYRRDDILSRRIATPSSRRRPSRSRSTSEFRP